MPNFYGGGQMWSPFQMPGSYAPTATPSSTYFNPDTGRMQFTPYAPSPAPMPMSAPMSAPAFGMGGMPVGGDFFAALAGLLGGGAGASAAPVMGRPLPPESMLAKMQAAEAGRAKLAADNAARAREIGPPRVGGFMPPESRTNVRPSRQPQRAPGATTGGASSTTNPLQHGGGLMAGTGSIGSGKNTLNVGESFGRGVTAGDKFGSRSNRAPGLTPSSSYRQPRGRGREASDAYGAFR